MIEETTTGILMKADMEIAFRVNAELVCDRALA